VIQGTFDSFAGVHRVDLSFLFKSTDSISD
jgi:hypothetical protein